MRDRRLTIVLFLGIACASFAGLPFVDVFASAQTGTQTRGPAKAPASKPAQDTQVYRNATFGFRYQIRYGWVDRTKEIRDQAAAETADSPQGNVLLAAFERPPNASGDTVNSAVVIASENASVYPKLKKAEDYIEPLTELATAKGFKADGDPSVAEIDGRHLVRADFIEPLTDKLTMHQSTLILLAKGRIVSFTFVAGSEDEIDDLIDGLHFEAAKSSAH